MVMKKLLLVFFISVFSLKAMDRPKGNSPQINTSLDIPEAGTGLFKKTKEQHLENILNQITSYQRRIVNLLKDYYGLSKNNFKNYKLWNENDFIFKPITDEFEKLKELVENEENNLSKEINNFEPINTMIKNILTNMRDIYIIALKKRDFGNFIKAREQEVRKIENSLSVFKQNVSSLDTSNKINKKTKEILLDLIKIAEEVINKIKSDFSLPFDEVKYDISNFNKIVSETIDINKFYSDSYQKIYTNLVDEVKYFINNSGSKDIPKLLEKDNGLSSLSKKLLVLIQEVSTQKDKIDRNKLILDISSLQEKFNQLAKDLNSIFTLRQGPKEAKEIFKLFLDNIFKVLDKLKQTYGLSQKSILTFLALGAGKSFGLTNKDFSEIQNINNYELKGFNLKNENYSKQKLFGDSLKYVSNFISDKNPYICFVKYYEQDKCKLPNGYDKQITIWDLYEDLLSFIDRTKSLPTIQGFKLDETEFKDKLNKFENALKAVKINHTQYEKESKILLEYIVKIYKKVVDKLKVDYKF